MISNKYKCIFVEVPKTGSTSIRRTIGFSKKPHMNIKEIQKELTEINKVFSGNGPVIEFLDYFKFGFVRNPWDRVVSLYNRQEGTMMSENMSFSNFVDWITHSSDTSIYPSKHKNQLDWFLDEDNQVAVDFIGRFERINEDWEIISKKINMNSKLEHHKINIKNQKHYTEYYSPKTMNIIGEKFKVDIEYFDYKYGE